MKTICYKAINKLLTNPEFIKLSVAFSFCFGNIIILSTIIDKIVEKYGFNTDDSGFFGTINVFGGFLGGIVFGVLLKKFKAYKTLNIVVWIASMISLIIFYFSLATKTKWIVTLAYALCGFTWYPSITIWFAYCSEITFPIKEATSGGLFILGSQISGFILTNIWDKVVDQWKDNTGVLVALLILIFVTGIGGLGAILMKPIPTEKNERLRTLSSHHGLTSIEIDESDLLDQDKKLSKS